MENMVKVTRENFMEEAEKLLREEAPKKGLSVSKAERAGIFWPKETPSECLFVTAIDAGGKPNLDAFALAVMLDPDDWVLIKRGTATIHISIRNPKNPLEELKEAVEKIPSTGENPVV